MNKCCEGILIGCDGSYVFFNSVFEVFMEFLSVDWELGFVLTRGDLFFIGFSLHDGLLKFC